MALRFAYDGSQFQSYARDPNVRSVEECLINALRREGYVEDSFKTGSRTDKGVSAAENVVSFRLEGNPAGLVHRVQGHLPPGLWATAAAEVPDDFTPRFHAVRTYQYFAPKQGEDLAAMQAACALFVGEHNMSGFARVEPHRNPMREIHECSVEEGAFWMFTIASPGFLWNQVRRMVDAILRVGQGKNTLEDIEAALESGEPHPTFKLAPAEGLLLKAVTYDFDWDPEFGTFNPGLIAKDHQQAQVRAGLMATLSASARPQS